MTNWDLYDVFEEEKGFEIDLGTKAFDEEEIIEYARVNDPLPFHIDKQVAKESFFGELVCSGGQAFYYFYVHRWIPKFGSSVVGGLGIRNWDFFLPIKVDETISAKAICEDIRHSKSNPMLSIVVWKFEFRNKSGNLAQSLEIKILHKRK
jgi:acyl dehydratase